MEFPDGFVNYEAFGAKGDGLADDLPAIVAAHDYANEHGLPVRSASAATYHLGRQALTVLIATDTDWNTSRFTVDDVDPDDHTKSLFQVVSLLEKIDLPITSLSRDQAQLDIKPQRDCWVKVTNDARRVYIRRGANQNDGVPAHDVFILRQDGRIDSSIDWDYDRVSEVEAHPIDDQPLTLRGGVFTTVANRMRQDVGYNYHGRNIEIRRSNTTIEGLVHYVTGETEFGHPYRGFLSAIACANVTFRNCFATPHKIYQTIGAAGKPVSMGSYDLHANNIVNFTMVGCRMNLITDRTRWGVIASNFCKNILLEDCELSRMDTHMGVSGGYTIRRCRLGWMGLNAIGRGPLLVEDCELFGRTLLNFRGDYGSTWQGDVTVRNCRWTPACGDVTWPTLLSTVNDGMHDFGYPCSMPHHVTIDGLVIDDRNHPENYTGPYILKDPDAGYEGDTADADRPFPYQSTQSVTIRNVEIVSGKPLQVSENAKLGEVVKVTAE